VDRVQLRLRQRAEQAGTTIALEASPEALARVVHVDVSVVEQILFNLVDNSCKYATGSTGPRTIHLEACSSDNSAMLRVRDHGTGISAEAARRLFQPFSKSAQQAAHSAPGVGLGLALCRRLSRAMGGELRWNSQIADGACFELSLPVAPLGAS
jgi:K+-sensing histidine kinase KdpD